MNDKKWRTRAVSFDRAYTRGTWASRVPYLGKLQRTRLLAREVRAISFGRPFAGKRVIDLGCGIGRFAVQAAAQGATVYGYDISGEAIRIARERAHSAGLSEQCVFEEVDVREADFPPADIWFDLGCLQYIHDIRGIVSRLKDADRFFCCLAGRHWLNIPRFLYRTVLLGMRYYTYTEADIRSVFDGYAKIRIEQRGLEYYVTSER